MQSPEFERARTRLRNAPWRSRTTDIALNLIEQGPSDASLIETLNSSEHAPAALEIFSALDTPSEPVFQAVRTLIGRQPLMSWCLVESLNRLAWYNGMRAFLSLPEKPTSSPCAYPFYMLVRNKVFIPSNLAGEIYHYYVNGLWRALPVARAGAWRHPHHSVLAILEMIERHFENGGPDTFVLYFTCLLLGQIGPFETSVQYLQGLIHGDCCPTVHRLASATLEHLPCGDCGAQCGAAEPAGRRRACQRRMSL